MALRQDRAQPGLQRASSVEISEQGAVGALPFAHAIELREERIRELTGGGRTGRTSQDGACRRPQVASIRGDEMLPSFGAALRAGAGQRQVAQMQRAEILFQFLRGWPRRIVGGRAKVFAGAGFQRNLKTIARQAPRPPAGFRKQAIDQGLAIRQEARRASPSLSTGRVVRPGASLESGLLALPIFWVLTHTRRHPIARTWHPRTYSGWPGIAEAPRRAFAVF